MRYAVLLVACVTAAFVVSGCGSSNSSSSEPTTPAAKTTAPETDAGTAQAEQAATAYWEAVAGGKAKSACKLTIGKQSDAPGCSGLSPKVEQLARKVVNGGPPKYDATPNGSELDLVVVKSGIVGTSLVMVQQDGKWIVEGGQFGT
jgi:hypothetical protein